MPCKNATSATNYYSICGRGLHGGKPSHGTCVRCEHNTDRAWHEEQVRVMLTVNQQPIVVPPQAAPVTILPMPRDRWPLWAKGVALRATPEDTGIGDVVERLAIKSKAKNIVEFAKAMGLPDCGCADRKLRWNQEYPLTGK